jgi:methyltransferase (TIGR00027 family)
MRRAAHQILDEPRVFEDPLAMSVIGRDAADWLRSTPETPGDRASRHLRAFMAARSRFAEDELSAAIARGAAQYVVLGAGLDTYAYRNRAPASDLRVFEVDHPATQAWKQTRLAEAGIAIPSSLRFVPVDFEKETLASALEDAGFDRTRITFFSWLGVTPYLTAEATMTTLVFIASLPAGSGVVFDYAVERSSLSPLEQMALDALASRVARAGEPFQLFLEPQALGAMLRAAGFHHLEDLGPLEIDARYFGHRTDGLRVGSGLAHLMSARV